MSTARFLLAPLLLLTLLCARATATPPPDASITAAAVDLERRLIAPCCWRETLDVHTSPTATELRHEIRSRLQAGESSLAIEKSLVARYGPKLRATLPDNLGYWLFALVVAGGLLAVRWLRIQDLQRKAKGARPTSSPLHAQTSPAAESSLPPLSAPARQRLEERLDDDLALMQLE